MTNRGTLRSVILVTGANGNIGRRVVVQLPGAGSAVRAATRNLGSTGLPGDVVRGDLPGPDTLAA